jgi:hypothetical protein
MVMRLRQAAAVFVDRYKNCWLIQRHGQQTQGSLPSDTMSPSGMIR